MLINLNGSFLMFSVSSIYGKSITKEISPTITTGYQLAFGGFILIIIGFVLGGRLTGFTLKSTSLLIYMAKEAINLLLFDCFDYSRAS